MRGTRSASWPRGTIATLGSFVAIAVVLAVVPARGAGAATGPDAERIDAKPGTPEAESRAHEESSGPHPDSGSISRGVQERGERPLCPRIKYQGSRYRLDRAKDLRRLIAALDREIDGRESSKASRKVRVAMRALATRLLEGGPAPERRGVEGDKGSEPLSRPDDGTEAMAQLLEMADAVRLDHRVPAPRRVDLIQLPFLYYDVSHNPVGRGKTEAWNLPAGSTLDTSRLDPLPTSFWTRPHDIPSLDLYEGLAPILRVDGEVCAYDAPKKSYGTSPGFSVKCGKRTIKVKFGETENLKRNSEVAVTRMFGALGYHVEPNDYAPEVRVRYDRRIFLEFNSRKELTIRITLLGFIPVHKIVIQKKFDPFPFVRYAVTKDGRRVEPDFLVQSLIRPEVLGRKPRTAARVPKGTSHDHYREDAAAFEATLDYLVMEEANVQEDVEDVKVGPWDWNHLDHAGRRELRGAGLLAAWTNYFDARWDNNRLRLVEENGQPALRHDVSDLGNSLGRAERIGTNAAGLVNEFPWTFTEGPAPARKGRARRPFRIVGYQPQVDNAPFLEMTLDDARWMARMIAQLTENQIEEALIATGYASAEVRLYTEKLISRRDAMIRDLGLGDEIAPLRPREIDRGFDYDPRTDGTVVARKADGSELRPLESRDLVVRHGAVVPR